MSESVRAHFDALRDLHVYGAFQPEFFALVETESSLMLEHALGARFIEWYDGAVPLTDPSTRTTVSVVVTDYAALGERFRRKWRLAEDSHFDGSLNALLRWAHDRHLLDGWLAPIWRRAKAGIKIEEQRRSAEKSRMPANWPDLTVAKRETWWESEFRPIWEREYLDNERELRNLLTHRTSRMKLISVDSARALRSLSEVICSLWAEAPDSSGETPTTRAEVSEPAQCRPTARLPRVDRREPRSRK